jgi:hypothetical protein
MDQLQSFAECDAFDYLLNARVQIRQRHPYEKSGREPTRKPREQSYRKGPSKSSITGALHELGHLVTDLRAWAGSASIWLWGVND